VQASATRNEEEHDERRMEERAGERPPRKAIISIHGRDVEECEIPSYSKGQSSNGQSEEDRAA
jgi:hypothetical protein